MVTPLSSPQDSAALKDNAVGPRKPGPALIEEPVLARDHRQPLNIRWILVGIAVLSLAVMVAFRLRPWPSLTPLLHTLWPLLSSAVAQCSVLVGAMLLATYLIATSVFRFANAKAARWSRCLQPFLHVTPNDLPQFRSTLQLDEGEKQRLQAQYTEIHGRMKHHLEIMAEFLANYYLAINMVSILGAVSGICLFYIGSKGWTNSSIYVVTIGVYSTVAAAYYLSFVTVFKQQENISDNRILYLQYVALGNELLSYCATGTSDVTPAETPAAFIRRVDKRTALINNIAIGFDYNKIVDYKHLLNTSFQPPTPPANGSQGGTQVTDETQAQDKEQGKAQFRVAASVDKGQRTASQAPAASPAGTNAQRAQGSAVARQPDSQNAGSAHQGVRGEEPVQTHAPEADLVVTK